MGYYSEKDIERMLRMQEEHDRLERSLLNAIDNDDIERQYHVEKRMSELEDDFNSRYAPSRSGSVDENFSGEPEVGEDEWRLKQEALQALAEEKGLVSDEEAFRTAEDARLKEEWGDLWNDDYVPDAPEF